MTYERQKLLVKRLLEKSRSDELNWEESAGIDAFQISFSQYGVRISDQITRITVSIVNSYGKVSENFTDKDLMGDEKEPREEWHLIMREIVELARRKAFGADEAISSILAEIM